MSTKTHSTLPATSIVEVIVAAALIASVMTAIAVNLLYTQRTLENTYRRSKATDYAASCLERFRSMRDSNEWPFFCKKVATWSTGVSGGVISYGSGASAVTVCPGFTYPGSSDAITYRIYYNSSATDYNYASSSNVTSVGMCAGDRTQANFVLHVDVEYKEANGGTRTVHVSDLFSRGAMDAEYR